MRIQSPIIKVMDISRKVLEANKERISTINSKNQARSSTNWSLILATYRLVQDSASITHVGRTVKFFMDSSKGFQITLLQV